ncbi:MAG: 6-bladed beta-propeller, partial [Tannerella sp.]|nr:6-bladed beta-propeller [Tannerella sp.]
MQAIKKIRLGFFVLLLFACKQENKTSTDNIVMLTLTEKSFVERVNTSQFFTSVKCIPLSTDDESLIGEISKVVHHENYIYVSDRFALYRFTEDGLFSGKIDKRGNGPDEYLYISDFEIESTDKVWILCRSSQTLNQYSWSEALNKKIKFNFRAAKMHLISSGKMCLYIGNERDENNRHQVKVIDLNTENVLNNFPEIDGKKAKYLHVNSPFHFCKKEDGLCYFYNIFDDYIYSLSEERITKLFQMNILGKNIPASFYDVEYADVSYFFQALFLNNYAYGTVLFLESETMYLYSYYYKKQCHVALISKETNKSVADFTTLTEDIAELSTGENIIGESDAEYQCFLFDRDSKVIIVVNLTLSSRPAHFSAG